MGKRGPKPKPSLLKVLEGNPSRRPLNAMEPVNHDPPAKPSIVTMCEIASGEWDRLLAAMPPGIYTALDTAVLTQYANAWAMYYRAQADIDRHGQLLEEPITRKIKKGDEYEYEIVGYTYKENPAIGTWAKAVQTLLKTTDRLGLSPGVRSKLEVPGGVGSAKPIQSPRAHLLGRQAG